MASRIGQFFLLMGVILCALFYLSYQQDPTPNETLLGLGILGVALGLVLIVRGLKASTPAERFRGLRKMRQRQAEARRKREEKRKAKEEARRAKRR